ncbi:MAG: competence/damage-inducible protein A [Betaproteobacteria bacterium]|nr:competence/damage-inducible protein A [Betaproteobacteria bacterium]
MGIGGIVIGDEIIRGKREDKHMKKLIELLRVRGMRLGWCEYIGDDRDRITATLKRSMATPDIVFSFGGIGATPDDHTRQCAAAATGADLALHPDAGREIRGRFGDDTAPLRLKMGEFPQGSSIIPNPYNRIPGFSIADHHFVPGFPVMAWPMVEWVLDTRYRELFNEVPEGDDSVVVYDSAESTLTPLMEAVEAKFAGLKVYSLPSMGQTGKRRHIELGVRGNPEAIAAAMEDLRTGVEKLGGRWEKPGSSQ